MITPSATNMTGQDTRKGDARPDLHAEVIERASLSPELAASMYGLYSQHYLDTAWSLFQEDLAAKTHVLVLTDARRRLRGFSTLQVYETTAPGTAVRVLYSGDTIVDPRHWGSPAFALAWLGFAGQVQRRGPAMPLYWLLIVKGHRTYRFLPTFARRYLPQRERPAAAAERRLLNALAAEKFGARFDPATGIVRFETPRGRLGETLAEVSARHRRLPAVAYFLERNPGYRDGDELVCLCELASGNLRPLAARVFAPSGATLRFS